MSKFYVEKPCDRDGNTYLRRQVIEAEPDHEGILGGMILKIIAPVETARRHVTTIGNWIETEGPARMLTPEEWARLTGWDGPI